MSGLILGGIGKGIADAGASIANMMYRGIELDRQDARDEEKERRLLIRQEALERLKEQMLEERAQKDAAKAIEVDKRATEIGQRRATGALDKLVESSAMAGEQGDIALSKEQLQGVVGSTPGLARQYQGMGLIDQNLPLTRNERRIQEAEDQVQAARELGASSTLLKSYQDTKKTVLEAIREENREKKSDQQHEQTMAQQQRLADQFKTSEERRSKEFQALLPIRQQNADANTTRADNSGKGRGDNSDKPPTGIDLERNAKAAEKALAMALGVPIKDVPEKVASLKRRNQITDEIQGKLDNYNSALDRWQGYKNNSSSSSSGSGGKDYSNLWK